MKKVELNNIDLEIIQGNIVQQPDCEAIVNAANAGLRTGGGVAGAIHTIGDPELANETKKLTPILPGQAVITSAPNLPNKYIIHCLGPVYGKDNPSDKILRDCYENALWLADDHKIRSIAFPALSTGAFGYPVREAAQVAFETIDDVSDKLRAVKLVRFVLWDSEDYDIHEEVLSQMSG
ncbi:MAG: macro domain-containing protein [Balneolaceae bacterium]|nr:macro domain-containing protein [Balneolaceae bacterium]